MDRSEGRPHAGGDRHRHGLRRNRAPDPRALMEKLEILRLPLGQRLLRYASLDDVAIWGVLALILLDWERVTGSSASLWRSP